MLKRPVRQLPSKNAVGQIEDVVVSVTPMTDRLVAHWQHHVQPLVDAHYRADPAPDDGRPVRADVGWRWARHWLKARLHNSVTWVPGNDSGKALGLCLVVDTGVTGWFPVGMLTTVPRLYCDACGDARHRAFTWYLADAPREFYQTVLNRHYVASVAKTLLDCSIQAALDQMEDGSLLLHADPQGGEHLRGFYRDRCQMRALPAGCPPITRIWRRSGSDQYFQFDDIEAAVFCAQFDPRR